MSILVTDAIWSRIESILKDIKHPADTPAPASVGTGPRACPDEGQPRGIVPTLSLSDIEKVCPKNLKYGSSGSLSHQRQGVGTGPRACPNLLHVACTDERTDRGGHGPSLQHRRHTAGTPGH